MRNPIDSIPSYANLFNTMSHSLVTNEQYHEVVPEYWDKYIKEKIEHIKLSHEWYLRDIATKVPAIIIRFEDLKTKPEETMTLVMKFLLG